MNTNAATRNLCTGVVRKKAYSHATQTAAVETAGGRAEHMKPLRTTTTSAPEPTMYTPMYTCLYKKMVDNACKCKTEWLQ